MLSNVIIMLLLCYIISPSSQSIGFSLSTGRSDTLSGESVRSKNKTQETGVVFPPLQSGTTVVGGGRDGIFHESLLTYFCAQSSILPRPTAAPGPFYTFFPIICPELPLG